MAACERNIDLATWVRDLGVKQTIVVSHEKGVIKSADKHVEMTQNATTNRSRVCAESLDLLA